jgi:hypothetical protein
MDLAHREAGLIWKGRREVAGLIREISVTPGEPSSDIEERFETCTACEGDLD